MRAPDSYDRAFRRSAINQRKHALALVSSRPIDRGENNLIQLAMDGVLVAEELPTKARERLFIELHMRGWTVFEMAEHTRTTEYTVARILARLGLDLITVRTEAVSA